MRIAAASQMGDRWHLRCGIGDVGDLSGGIERCRFYRETGRRLPVEELRCSIRRLALPEERGLPPAVAEFMGRRVVLEWEWMD